MTQQGAPVEADPPGGDDALEARYQIGEVAERTGVTQRTLRFYEERGLLQPSERMEGGFRLYSEHDIDRIELIKRLQSLLNLSLADIKEMVDAEELLVQIRATFRPDRELPARKRRAEKVRAALQLQSDIVEKKIEQLREMQQVIHERFETMDRVEREISEAMAKSGEDGA